MVLWPLAEPAIGTKFFTASDAPALIPLILHYIKVLGKLWVMKVKFPGATAPDWQVLTYFQLHCHTSFRRLVSI